MGPVTFQMPVALFFLNPLNCHPILFCAMMLVPFPRIVSVVFPVPDSFTDCRLPDEFQMRFLRCQVLCISISVVISHSVRDFVA